MFDLLLNPPEEENKQIVLIKYPGIVKNLDKALETMGGLQQISTNYFNNQNLELSHTPDNPFTSRIMSEKRNQDVVSSGTLHLVMKIRRKKKKPEVVKTELIGMVNSVYTFDVMCDFQYLPLRRRHPQQDFEDLIPTLIPTDISSALSWWDRKDPQSTTLFLPPYQFSRYLTPSTKILGRETDHTEKTRKAAKQGYGQNLRVERKALSITVHATDEFPTQPTQEAIDDADFRCKHEEPHRLLRELFAERPMWTRIAVLYRTGLEDSLLRSLFQKYAFYIQSGPWGRLWCRFGYDPRLDKSGGEYQTLMVSFRQHGGIPERQRLKVSTERSIAAYSTHQGGDNDPISYVYEKGKLPRVRQMWYCIVDVHLPEAIELLNTEYDFTPENVAMAGWIPQQIVEKVRDAVKDDVKNTSTEVDDYFNRITVDEDF